ncbi:cytochrome P450 CYP82D47-like [Mercurialis annua]|uniref:cytochrome P450 CYP82D47-like n=1 Tax=Mercurialis annua TaxID=3986 RepID=UPI00215E3052|nr:cytochrome P450 CYP82D47-like [Mercurialis annua]
MEIFLSFSSNTMAPATVTVAFLIICSFLWLSRNLIAKKKKEAPEAGGAWPLLGHLHLLGGLEPPHVVLGNMADKYGPIFSIKMGIHKTLVVNNWETAKECFTTNDRTFADRPKTLALELLAYNRSMIGLSSYGNYWRQTRKIATLELLSNHRIEMQRHVRESEMRTALKELYRAWEKKKSSENSKVLVDMKRWFGDITLNVTLSIVVGKSVGYATNNKESDEEWKQASRDFFHLIGKFVAADAVPFLRWFDIGGHEKAMKDTAKKLDIVAQQWLKEHKEKKASGHREEDFMDVMLHLIDQEAEATLGRDSDTINKATCLQLILTAADTISITLMWALSLLVNNPQVMRKAQREIDAYIGRERQVRESDINYLVYLNAIVKETMRLYPPGPLSVPHESMEDCTVAGYYIPRGTRLLTNIWKIQRDPKVWSNPSEYQPERFLTDHRDFDVRGQHFEYIPFGSGRRMCPGISFALQILQLTLATLLHGFDFSPPTNEPIDMTETSGLTNIRATPLEVLINPRLESHSYQ